MRKTLITAAALAALLAGPALAQGRGGGHGGGFGGGMGAGPPMSPPGQSTFGERGASSSARDIAAQRGEFGRNFAADRRMTTAERQAFVQERRATALRYASGTGVTRRVLAYPHIVASWLGCCRSRKSPSRSER